MSLHALVLYPADPDTAPEDDEAFLRFLRERGFLGSQIRETTENDRWAIYQHGERFFDCVEFYGSHEVIELKPTPEGFIRSGPHDSRNYCRIEVSEERRTEFYGGVNVERPRCSSCGNLFDNWPELLNDWYESDRSARWRCPWCDMDLACPELDWRETAGFGGYWIRMHSIYHGEAAPSDAFLALLAEHCGWEWRYFYLYI